MMAVTFLGFGHGSGESWPSYRTKAILPECFCARELIFFTHRPEDDRQLVTDCFTEDSQFCDLASASEIQAVVFDNTKILR